MGWYVVGIEDGYEFFVGDFECFVEVVGFGVFVVGVY